MTSIPISQASDFLPLDPADPRAEPCDSCKPGESLGFQFSYAFQPIVDISTRRIFAHEALVRGPQGEAAPTVLSKVNGTNRYRFDQACRAKAIKAAAHLQMKSMLSINFMPNAIYKPELCIRATLAAAKTHGFPIDRIIFETVEGEHINDGKWLAEILREYKRIGSLTAIDDFGAGYAGLNLLAQFQPDIVKLDMELVRDAVAGIGLVERDEGELALFLDLQALVTGVVDGGFGGHDGLTVNGQAFMLNGPTINCKSQKRPSYP